MEGLILIGMMIVGLGVADIDKTVHKEEYVEMLKQEIKQYEGDTVVEHGGDFGKQVAKRD